MRLNTSYSVRRIIHLPHWHVALLKYCPSPHSEKRLHSLKKREKIENESSGCFYVIIFNKVQVMVVSSRIGWFRDTLNVSGTIALNIGGGGVGPRLFHGIASP